jgi:hypothetical protein
VSIDSPVQLYKALSTPVDRVDDDGHVSGWASAPIVDHAGHLLVGESCDLSLFQTNPVVLFGHDRLQPVGISITPTGEFGLQAKPFHNGLTGLYHTTRFNRHLPLGETLYKSYADGFLRGWSLTMFCRKKLTAVPDKYAKALGSVPKGALFIPDAYVLEYSAVPIPENAACLTDLRWKALNLPEAVTAAIATRTPAGPTVVSGARLPTVAATEPTPAGDESRLLILTKALSTAVDLCLVPSEPETSAQPSLSETVMTPPVTIDAPNPPVATTQPNAPAPVTAPAEPTSTTPTAPVPPVVSKALSADDFTPASVETAQRMAGALQDFVYYAMSNLRSDSPDVRTANEDFIRTACDIGMRVIDVHLGLFPDHEAELKNSRRWFADARPDDDGGETSKAFSTRSLLSDLGRIKQSVTALPSAVDEHLGATLAKALGVGLEALRSRLTDHIDARIGEQTAAVRGMVVEAARTTITATSTPVGRR